MGVEYTPVGGIGLLLDQEMINSIKSITNFTEEQWEDLIGCIETLNLEYSVIGDSYEENDKQIVFLVPGNTYREIQFNIPDFLNKLDSYGIQKTEDDLEVISELYIW